MWYTVQSLCLPLPRRPLKVFCLAYFVFSRTTWIGLKRTHSVWIGLRELKASYCLGSHYCEFLFISDSLTVGMDPGWPEVGFFIFILRVRQTDCLSPGENRKWNLNLMPRSWPQITIVFHHVISWENPNCHLLLIFSTMVSVIQWPLWALAVEAVSLVFQDGLNIAM